MGRVGGWGVHNSTPRFLPRLPTTVLCTVCAGLPDCPFAQQYTEIPAPTADHSPLHSVCGLAGLPLWPGLQSSNSLPPLDNPRSTFFFRIGKI